MSAGPTHAGKHVTQSIACARSQHYTHDQVFLLAQMTLCAKTLRNFPPFVGLSVISDAHTQGLLIRLLVRSTA